MAFLAAMLVAVPLVAPAPDLRVASITTQERAVASGRLLVPTTVENMGDRAARRSRTRYFLSRDAERGHDIRMRGVRIPRIAAGARFTKTARLRVPAPTKGGSYYLIACADARRKVREEREGNNCMVSAGTIDVSRQTEPQVPPGPG